MNNIDLEYLTRHRGDPDVRVVLDDLELTLHGRRSRVLHALSLNYTADAADAATTAATAATTDAAATTAATAAFSKQLKECDQMREGLMLLKLPGYYGPVRVGWLKRISGDNYELLPGSVLLVRTKGTRKLAELAAKGPLDDHKCEDRAETSLDVNEFRVWQPWQCNEEAWKEHCPRPKDWP